MMNNGNLQSMPSGATHSAPGAARGRQAITFGHISSLLKLRIGMVMTLTAVVAMIVTPGQRLTAVEMIVLAFAILISSGSAGAFNHYYEVDLDRLSPRTCNRPFVTGVLKKGPFWLAVIIMLLVTGVGSAAWVLNGMAALYIFLGAFFYAIVYTVWLKRQSWMNIVVGGASGSFAVLAGAAAVDPGLSPVPILLALVLFFWTPSHFWSLAIAKKGDYARAGVPMLPVVVGNRRAAKVVFLNTLILVVISVLPVFYGMGWIYLLAAISGGGLFLFRNVQMMADPSPRIAMQSFMASLLQLILLLAGAVLDVQLLGL